MFSVYIFIHFDWVESMDGWMDGSTEIDSIYIFKQTKKAESTHFKTFKDLHINSTLGSRIKIQTKFTKLFSSTHLETLYGKITHSFTNCVRSRFQSGFW